MNAFDIAGEAVFIIAMNLPRNCAISSPEIDWLCDQARRFHAGGFFFGRVVKLLRDLTLPQLR